MADLYKVSVIEKEDRILKLELIIIHPDQRRFVEKKEAGIAILVESIIDGPIENSALGRSIGQIEHLYNTDWYKENASRYIENFKRTGTKNFPVKKSVYKLQGDDFRNFWEKEEQLPRAEYKLQVTDPAWIAHLNVGDSWGSAATDYLD